MNKIFSYIKSNFFIKISIVICLILTLLFGIMVFLSEENTSNDIENLKSLGYFSVDIGIVFFRFCSSDFHFSCFSLFFAGRFLFEVVAHHSISRRYLTFLGLYIGFGAVCVGVFKYEPPAGVWSTACQSVIERGSESKRRRTRCPGARTVCSASFNHHCVIVPHWRQSTY